MSLGVKVLTAGLREISPASETSLDGRIHSLIGTYLTSGRGIYRV
jgi:hypothetical protein